MNSWGERPSEVANLMNPWFCGLLLRSAAEGWTVEGKVRCPPLAARVAVMGGVPKRVGRARVRKARR